MHVPILDMKAVEVESVWTSQLFGSPRSPSTKAQEKWE